MNNTIVLGGCTTTFKNQNGLQSVPDDAAFEIFSSLQVTKGSEVAFSDIEDSIVDGGQDGGVDSVT